MRHVLLGIACGAMLGFGGGYAVFGRDPAATITTCTDGTTGRIDLSTGAPAHQRTCVTTRY